MSSTESSAASSTPEAAARFEPPVAGKEFRQAVAPDGGFGWDPLVHPDPYAPPWFYRWASAVVRWLVRTFFRFQVEGLENVPEPPFIIASNHQAWYDTLFIVAAFPKLPMIYTMARRDTVFNRRWKAWLVRQFGVFPIQPSQGELDERGVANVYQILHRRGIVLIFPEGRYSRGRRLRPLKKGVAHFALQAGVPICPVALSGLDRLRPFREVLVSIGPPIQPDPPAWWELDRRVARVVDRVRRSILRAFGAEPAEQESGRVLDVLRSRLRRLLRRQAADKAPAGP
jgi:1-acyl-sn-glycerol-3-phosphate acyltransferase